MKLKGVILSVGLILLIILANSFYVLDQRETSIVVQFGRVVAQETEPGLKLKIPFVQVVHIFDKRIQNINFDMSDTSEVVALDQKTMKLDAYAKYRVSDPKKFFESVKNDSVFRARVGSIIESSIREIIGGIKFIDILGDRRSMIREDVLKLVKNEAQNFGVDVIDVRIIRVNLPDRARDAVYARMKTDREKEAKEIRAIGMQESEMIKAAAEKKKTVILAEATRDAEILKGEGDAAALSIYAKSYGKDKSFYEYYKSLEIYKKSFDEKSRFVISSSNKFLKFFSKE